MANPDNTTELDSVARSSDSPDFPLSDEESSPSSSARPLSDVFLFGRSALGPPAPLPERTFKLDALRGSELDDQSGLSAEFLKLSSYVRKYAPVFRQLPALLKPSPQPFIPAIGEVDALLKIERPDGKDDKAGTAALDEPALQQSNPAELRLEFRTLRPARKSADPRGMQVGVIEEEGEGRRRQIDRWIRTVRRLRDQYQIDRNPWPADVPPPDLKKLMSEWPNKLNVHFFSSTAAGLKLEETPLSLSEILKVGCALLDIPTIPNQLNKSLHVLWMLYYELTNNGHACAPEGDSCHHEP
ncbi:hypothetical protein BESB_004250 [Besnoitia besnoiti]|uniref:Intraflagellar transport complex B protein 46 carboxy-terminal protein n=1 Tax=Besnoitia besnoiti TaxID=94643 RepID=A0A2A9MLF5_BESBE|nr:hypothetical protein BESB_004250 [Besnoitia besnoiti]PFH38084.1 hypothetical protein BESB_004250 [Besnoitia besnoiti]